MPNEYILVALLLINLAGLAVVALDKHKARKRKWRIPEKTFFLLALLGASPGVFAGMLLFRHKTRHWYFMTGIPLILLLEIAAACFILWKR